MNSNPKNYHYLNLPVVQHCDFISSLYSHGLFIVVEIILSYLDAKSLRTAELVNKEWYRVISECMSWKKFIERHVSRDTTWKDLSIHRGWAKYFDKKNTPLPDNVLSIYEQNTFYKNLCFNAIKDVEKVKQNRAKGNCSVKNINCQNSRSEDISIVFCIQYDNEKIVSGLCYGAIKVWDLASLQLLKTLIGHTGSVYCLQFDKNIIVSGSSDRTVRVWDMNTGQNVLTLSEHLAVLSLRFMDRILITCSADCQIMVWNMHSPSDIQLKGKLIGHKDGINTVDFDTRYIVSGSGDKTIKVWLTSTGKFVRNLLGHERSVACLQFKGNMVVSGSKDTTIRIWDVETGECVRILQGHHDHVRCVQFDDDRIVSGSLDGTIKIWDLKKALARLPSKPSPLCTRTFYLHGQYVLRLQFDKLKIVSANVNTITIWDFLDAPNYSMVYSIGWSLSSLVKHFLFRLYLAFVRAYIVTENE